MKKSDPATLIAKDRVPALCFASVKFTEALALHQRTQQQLLGKIRLNFSQKTTLKIPSVNTYSISFSHLTLDAKEKVQEA